MSIKEKSTFKKDELTYESPDGDTWDIVIVEHDNRRYIQFKKTGDTDFITMDGSMLLDMADAYRKKTLSKSNFAGVNKKAFEVPSIVDHRAIEKRGVEIQKKVDETMQNQDNSVEPVQSFSPASNTPQIVSNDYTEFRTGGVTVESASQKVGPTPEEWTVRKPEEELSGWQKDAQSRKKMRPPTKKIGYEGEGFKRVGARDII